MGKRERNILHGKREQADGGVTTINADTGREAGCLLFHLPEKGSGPGFLPSRLINEFEYRLWCHFRRSRCLNELRSQGASRC